MDPIKTTVRERSKRPGSIRRFEDLIAWQKARELTRAVYDSTGHGAFSQDFGLKRQIQRAAVSMMSNIAEGFERHRPREFHRFLSIAKSSCAERRSQLCVACDVGYLDRSNFERFMNQAEEVARIIGGLRASLAIDK
ncbi:MAG: four helix bundle protein [Planctomycetes bacterium]|nr:four helix bundle protein [Planctomycetota bacterium]